MILNDYQKMREYALTKQTNKQTTPPFQGSKRKMGEKTTAEELWGFFQSLIS